MELRALRYFAEVVRHKSFSAAAEVLFVSQPTVSKMIHVLEEELGTPLLARYDGQRKRQVVLTDAGKLVYARAEEMLSAESSLKADLDALNDLTRGELVLGIPPLGATLLAPAIARFHEQWPGIEVRLLESGSRGVEAALRSSELEVGIFLAPVTEDLDFISICDFPLQLLAPRASKWQGKKTVALAELVDESFLLYGETYMLNAVIGRACQQVGFTPRVACRSSQWDLIAELVDCGMGIALMPEPYSKALDKSRFVSIPVIEPEVRWNLVLAWRRTAYLSHAARAWLKTARTHFGSQGQSQLEDNAGRQ